MSNPCRCSTCPNKILYWFAASERDFDTAQFLCKGKRYDACLFFCHLTLEKLIKGLVVVKTKEPAPYSHNLSALAALAGLALSKDQLQALRIITTFNIAGRYDDDKQTFYQTCTKEYAKQYLSVTKHLRQWLTDQYPGKLKKTSKSM